MASAQYSRAAMGMLKLRHCCDRTIQGSRRGPRARLHRRRDRERRRGFFFLKLSFTKGAGLRSVPIIMGSRLVCGQRYIRASNSDRGGASRMSRFQLQAAWV